MVLIPLFTGCTFYEWPGRCHDCEGDTAVTVSGLSEQDKSDDDSEAERSVHFAVEPSDIATGETAIFEISADRAFPFDGVVEVHGGPLEAIAISPHEGSLLVTLAAAPDAREGAVDLVLYLEDGNVALLDDAILVRRGGDGS